jgi:hypothetical protein
LPKRYVQFLIRDFGIPVDFGVSGPNPRARFGGFAIVSSIPIHSFTVTNSALDINTLFVKGKKGIRKEEVQAI